MLFWSFVILLVIGIVCVIIYNHTMVDDWCLGLGSVLTIISSIVVAIMSGVIICHHTTVIFGRMNFGLTFRLLREKIQ